MLLKALYGAYLSRTAMSEVTVRKDIDAFTPKFMSVAPFMKLWGFREDREYRILLSRFPSDKIPATASRGTVRTKCG
jgi:hypothetical protein